MNRYILLLLFCVSVFCINGQDMKTVFINMPDQYIPQLESAWRKDLVDLYTSGKEARLQNTMNGYSHLNKLTEDYLLIQVTERSTVEMKMLPLVNNTHIVCIITTVNAPVPDSRIEFYSTEWELLPSEEMLTPVSADWFTKEDIDKNKDDFKNAMARLDMDLFQYQLNPDSLTLTVTYTTPLYLDQTERTKVLSFLKGSPKIYTWEKSHFN